MYKSPIQVAHNKVMDEVRRAFDNDILSSILSYDIHVDRGELIRALQYDRNQYEKGYADGKADAMAELVRCKDCKYWECYGGEDSYKGECTMLVGAEGCWYESDFCSYGERRSGDE